MFFKSFAFSAQGESHKKNHNKPCEDYSGRFDNELYHLAAVADGHGNDKYFRSRFGSKFAVAAASEEIDRFMIATAEKGVGFFKESAKDNTQGMEENLKKLENNIVSSWKSKVLQHIKDNALTEMEKAFCKEKGVTLDLESEEALISIYGSTLLAVLVTEKFWFALQIGDGACVIIPSDLRARFAVPDDTEQGLGSTHSLCNRDAVQYFRHGFGFERLIGATAASDGVTDSFPADRYLDFNAGNLLEGFIKNPDEAANELKSFLPKLSQTGSQDDVSIAGIFNIEAAQPVLPYLGVFIEQQKKTRKARQDAEQASMNLVLASQELEILKNENIQLKAVFHKEKDAHTATLQALNSERAGHENAKKAMEELGKTGLVSLTSTSQELENLKNQNIRLKAIFYKEKDAHTATLQALNSERAQHENAKKAMEELKKARLEHEMSKKRFEQNVNKEIFVKNTAIEKKIDPLAERLKTPPMKQPQFIKNPNFSTRLRRRKCMRNVGRFKIMIPNRMLCAGAAKRPSEHGKAVNRVLVILKLPMPEQITQKIKVVKNKKDYRTRKRFFRANAYQTE